MKRLLRLQIRNLFHSKMFYFYLIFNSIMVVVGYFLSNIMTELGGTTTKVFQSIINLMSSEPDFIGQIFIIVFVCSEFHSGTIKNIIGRGYTRFQLLLSKYVVATIGVLCTNILYVIISFILYGKYGIGFETNMIYSIIICLIAIVVLTIFYSTIAFVLEKNLIGILTIIFLPRVIDLSFLAIYNFFKVELDSYWITGILPKFLDNPTLGNMIQPIILFIIYLIIIVFVGNRIIWRKEIK